MNWALRLALRLYPRRWRRRYGREFEALVEDSGTGWLDVFDILRGAFAMRIKDFRTIPLVAALVGACVGTVVYLRAPALYASTSTVRMTDGSLVDRNSGSHRALADRLSRVLATTRARAATSVTVVKSGDDSSIVRISHSAADAHQAQEVVKRLVAAIEGSLGSVALGTVIEPPDVPSKAERVRPPTSIAFGQDSG